MAEKFDPYHRWLGISPKHQPPDHYRLLGIEQFESDPEVIRDAAQQRMAHVRTYQLGQYVELSQKILNELGAAKACLSNPVTKAAYDEELRWFHGTSTRGSAARPAETPSVLGEPEIFAIAPSDLDPPSASSPLPASPESPIQATFSRRRVPIRKRPSFPFRKLVVVVSVLGVVAIIGTSLWYIKTQHDVALAKQEQEREKQEQERAKQDRLVQRQLKHDRVQNAQKTTQEVQKAADAAFQTKTRTTAYEQGKRFAAEGTRAMAAGELDSAERLFGQSSQSFAKSQEEAPAVNELSKAQEAWTVALAAADKELLKNHAGSQFAAAQDKAAAAEKQVPAEKFQEGVVLFREAIDVLAHAVTEATAIAQRAEAHSPPLATAPFSADVAREHQQRWAKHLNIPVEQTISIGMEMVLIPPGEFMMGSSDSDNIAGSDEKPQHRVRITEPFYLGKYLVTQEQWEAVMGNTPSHFKGPKNPVERLSWDDCQQFLAKLNAKFRHGGGMFQLPTEAQWEYACRAGSTTKWYFGDEQSSVGDYAWYNENSGQTTHPVGQKKPNAWGLYDMHGNVWERCQDWYDAKYYAASPANDPKGPDSGSQCVLRGGNWNNWPYITCSARRSGNSPYIRNINSGFRVALALAEPLAERPTQESTAPLKINPISPQTAVTAKHDTLTGQGSLPTGSVRIINRVTGLSLGITGSVLGPFRFEPAGEDSYRILAKSGSFLTLADWACKKGAAYSPIQGGHKSWLHTEPDFKSSFPAMLWEIKPIGDGFWVITNRASRQSLEGHQEVPVFWQSPYREGALEQQWRFEPIVPMQSTPAASLSLIAPPSDAASSLPSSPRPKPDQSSKRESVSTGWVRIINRSSGLVIGVNKASLAQGVEVVQYSTPGNEGAESRWRIRRTNVSDIYGLRNQNSDQFLVIEGRSQKRGARACQMPYSASAHPALGWEFQLLSTSSPERRKDPRATIGGSWRIVNLASGQCLGVDGNAPGLVVKQFPFRSSDNGPLTQQWRLEPFTPE